MQAAADAAPIEIVGRGRTYRVADRIAIGSISVLYRCAFLADGRQIEGTFKLARDASTNPHIANEAETLRLLHAAGDSSR